jgi:hypothetical protein
VRSDRLALLLLLLWAFRSKSVLRPEATHTPLKVADVLAALRGSGVPEVALPLVAAQSAFETDGWQQTWNFNIGNVTQPDPRKAHVYQPGNTLPFATYPNLALGAKAYVDLLTVRGVIQKAPDLDAYVAALKAAGYAGAADYDAYKRGMQRWLPSFQTPIQGESYG